MSKVNSFSLNPLPVDSSAARIPLPGATILWAISLSSFFCSGVRKGYAWGILTLDRRRHKTGDEMMTNILYCCKGRYTESKGSTWVWNCSRMLVVLDRPWENTLWAWQEVHWDGSGGVVSLFGLTFSCLSCCWKKKSNQIVPQPCSCSCCSCNCWSNIVLFMCCGCSLFPRHNMQQHKGSSVKEPSTLLQISDHPGKITTSMWMTFSFPSLLSLTFLFPFPPHSSSDPHPLNTPPPSLSPRLCLHYQ